MFRVLFILFVVIPIIEIAVLMQVGAILGAWPTVAVVILTAWLGAKNVRQQGLQTIQTLQTKLAHGEQPSEEIVSGLMLMIAGVLLVTPGFVTDFFGLALLVPSFRRALMQSVQGQLSARSGQQSSFHFQQYQSFDASNESQSPFSEKPQDDKNNSGKVLDGEFERKD